MLYDKRVGVPSGDIFLNFGLESDNAGFDSIGIWRISNSFITRCYKDDPVDQVKYETIRKAVSYMNRAGLFKHPMRVVKKAREPLQKQVLSGRTRPVGYNWNGDVIGGINNAAAFDVYIYRK